jgi:transcriptional regulator with XRE-family HTH domain
MLAEKTGVSEATIKIFERSGQITLSRLLLIARALGALGGFATLFEAPAARSLEELEGRQRTRQRGRRRS